MNFFILIFEKGWRNLKLRTPERRVWSVLAARCRHSRFPYLFFFFFFFFCYFFSSSFSRVEILSFLFRGAFSSCFSLADSAKFSSFFHQWWISQFLSSFFSHVIIHGRSARIYFRTIRPSSSKHSVLFPSVVQTHEAFLVSSCPPSPFTGVVPSTSRALLHCYPDTRGALSIRKARLITVQSDWLILSFFLSLTQASFVHVPGCLRAPLESSGKARREEGGEAWDSLEPTNEFSSCPGENELKCSKGTEGKRKRERAKTNNLFIQAFRIVGALSSRSLARLPANFVGGSIFRFDIAPN